REETPNRGSKRGVFPFQAVDDLSNFRERDLRRLAGKRPALELEETPIGVGRELTAPFDDGGVKRGVSEERLRRPRAELGAELLQSREHPTHSQDRVLPFVGPAAVRGAAER